jgi:hypothetical protein
MFLEPRIGSLNSLLERDSRPTSGSFRGVPNLVGVETRADSVANCRQEEFGWFTNPRILAPTDVHDVLAS